MRLFVEACCTSAADACEAERQGAQRIELCERLDVGGVTPTPANIQEVLRKCRRAKVNVLIRCREGDFVYSEQEIQQMIGDIHLCRLLGVNGVVVGALTPDGHVDQTVMKRFIAAARPLSVTFHRAFDECKDPRQALDDIMALGCDRLLTSGHEADAYQGRFTIARLVGQAAGRIVIMPGCGIRAHNILDIASTTHAEEFHSSAISQMSELVNHPL
ncbi:MAG: copper homeostasis protein CutC [Bacteroidales bacterium]|nr:copper homeostasis protein CutC [Bacteroidales bacterium]